MIGIIILCHSQYKTLNIFQSLTTEVSENRMRSKYWVKRVGKKAVFKYNLITDIFNSPPMGEKNPNNNKTIQTNNKINQTKPKQTQRNPNKNSLMLPVQINKMTWLHLLYSRSCCGSK